MNSRMQASGQRRHLPAEEIDRRADRARRLAEHGVEIERAEDHEDREDAEREAEIADAVDDEGLDRGGVGRSAGRTRSRSADRSRGPTPSQPKNSCTKLSAVTSISMKKVKRLR